MRVPSNEKRNGAVEQRIVEPNHVQIIKSCLFPALLILGDELWSFPLQIDVDS